MSKPLFTDDDADIYTPSRRCGISIDKANRVIEERGIRVVKIKGDHKWFATPYNQIAEEEAILINIQPIEQEPELTELEQANYLLGLARNVAKCWLIDEPNMILPQIFLDRTSYLEVGASLKDGAE